MGSCLSSKSNQADSPQQEPNPEPKTYSWDKRETVDKTKFFVRNLKGTENALLRDDVDDLPMTIDSCEDTFIFLKGVTKTLTIDDCKNVTIVAFSADSVYIRNSSNLKVVLACGQYRCRDCRNLELYLHCSTQPVIESSTKIQTSPLILDFDGIETILEKMKISKFNNLWSKVHDFGPVGDEDNWSTLDNPMLELESLYSLIATVLPTSKLNASKSSLFPILEKSPDENPMNLIFIILTGPNAEETATSLYISLFYKTNKAILVQSCAGKFSGISIPTRARKQLPDLENEAHLIGLLFYGSVSAVELSDFVTPGAAFSSFQNDAKADSDLLFNSRNLVFE